MFDRMNAWVTDLLDGHARSQGQVNILVASHESPIAVLAKILLDPARPYKAAIQPGVVVSDTVVNTSITRMTLRRTETGWDCCIDSWSEDAHVPW